MTNTMPNVLILTGSIGAGHVSVARAISEALYRKSAGKTSPGLHVEILDIITELKNIPATAMKKIYLGSLKLSPKIYELIFQQTSESDWPLKLFNVISAPFMQQKLLAVLREKKPDLLISTIPTWDIIIKKIWSRYAREQAAFSPNLKAPDERGVGLVGSHVERKKGRGASPSTARRASGGTLGSPRIKKPFVSIVTDSISIHRAWTLGKPDFFIVANNDTKSAIENLGIPNQSIKVFGYPVSKRFLNREGREDFEARWNLSPKKKTLLLILSTGLQWRKIKQLAAIIQKSPLQKLQLVIVACGDKKWKKKLSAIDWPWETRVTGWTKEMHAFIRSADIVCTKAGGSTVMECIASGKPMIIIDALPGQEIGNAMLVQKYNLGVVLNRDCEDFDDAITYILSHEALIKKNLASQQTPDAEEKIARFLLGLLPLDRS